MPSTLTNLLYHITFSTKKRVNTILEFKEDLYKNIYSNIVNLGGRVFAINGMPDHIHIAARFLPRHRFSDLLQVIKGNSSKWVNEQRKCRGHFQWQIGYGAFTVSKSRLDSVVRYIQNQEEHHKIKTFKEEFIELLEAHEIEYDERYLWD